MRLRITDVVAYDSALGTYVSGVIIPKFSTVFLTLTSIAPRSSRMNVLKLSRTFLVSLLTCIFMAAKQKSWKNKFADALKTELLTFSIRFHSTGCVDSVTEETVSWHLYPNNASTTRT